MSIRIATGGEIPPRGEGEGDVVPTKAKPGLRSRTGATPLTAPQRALRARIGAFSAHATHDTRDLTAKARIAFLSKFEDEVDPDRRLSEAERGRRALAARRAFMAALAYRSSRERSTRSRDRKQETRRDSLDQPDGRPVRAQAHKRSAKEAT